MDQLRATNSPDQRDRLLTKFISQLDSRGAAGGIIGSVIGGAGGGRGSVVGRGESRLGVISETESYKVKDGGYNVSPDKQSQ